MAAEEEESRSSRWPRLFHVAELSSPGRYAALVEAEASEETLTQIEKDLPRTLSHTGLMKPGTPAQRCAVSAASLRKER